MTKHQLTGYMLPDGMKMRSVARTGGYWRDGDVYRIECEPSERKLRIWANEGEKERGVCIVIEVPFFALSQILQFALESAAKEIDSSGV